MKKLWDDEAWEDYFLFIDKAIQQHMRKIYSVNVKSL